MVSNWFNSLEALRSAGPNEVLGPPDFIRIDGLDRDLDQFLLNSQSRDNDLLAVFAEPASWAAYCDGLKRGRPDFGLNYYALVVTFKKTLAGRRFSPADFKRFEGYFTRAYEKTRHHVSLDTADKVDQASDGRLEATDGGATPFEQIDSRERFFTFRSTVYLALTDRRGGRAFDSRFHSVSSAVLAGGRIVFLHLYGGPEDPPAGQLVAKAVSWRDEYLLATGA